MWETISKYLDWILFGIAMLVVVIVAAVNRERLIRYVQEVRQEWTRVSTPSREESVSHTSIVLVAVAITAVFLYVVDFALSRLHQFWYYR